MEFKCKFAVTLKNNSSHENSIEKFHQKTPEIFYVTTHTLKIAKTMMRRVLLDGTDGTDRIPT